MESIKECLANHVNPEPLIVAERFRFWSHHQQSDEGLKDFAVRLQKLSATCQFKDFTDEALHDCFILGLNEKCKLVQPSLLVEPHLTFKKAVEMAHQFKSAAHESRMIEGSAGEV
ncbi:hypothetical protein RF11_01984 [Thelohanellus kitauei]|uniref:Retrotransposon gag domain-containing protein n=1 Tax=Thelohanellus kitauei TaxID=669202 RepID=A0A0C2JFE4_THEKT|nr:hypothetical protein RF11_01984 [Thelohanellus kitauei]